MTCIAKEEEGEEDVDPEYLFAPNADATRPITNLAAWFSLWSMVRYEHRTEWREQWLHKNMHGARTRHEIYHVSWRLALEIENKQLQGTDFSGASLDRKKFFDLIDHDIAEGILQKLGAPKAIVEAEKKFYNQLTCRWKVGTSISEPWTRTCGYIQGSSWSLDAALALMTIWTKTIEAETEVTTGGFLDDSNYFASGTDHI